MATLDDVVWISNQTVLIEFHLPQESPDTEIYDVLTFNHWIDYMDDETGPKLMHYIGPVRAIHNSTSNCTMGLGEPLNKLTSNRCEEQNFVDLRLNQWEEMPHVTNRNQLEALPAGLKFSHDIVLYCLYHNITIAAHPIHSVYLLRAHSIPAI